MSTCCPESQGCRSLCRCLPQLPSPCMEGEEMALILLSQGSGQSQAWNLELLTYPLPHFPHTQWVSHLNKHQNDLRVCILTNSQMMLIMLVRNHALKITVLGNSLVPRNGGWDPRTLRSHVLKFALETSLSGPQFLIL